MSVISLEPIDGRAFSARVEDLEGPSLQVMLSGTADLAVQKELKSFLAEVHGHATGHLTNSVVVDLSTLEFMNSSCLKTMVGWILQVRGENAGRQYRIVFRTNPKIQWQRRSVDALACMATDLVSVVEIGHRPRQ